jgi:hypothetical protein
MNTPLQKRGQDSEKTYSSPNPPKRACFSLDKLHGCETSDEFATTENESRCQDLELGDFQTLGHDTVELDSSDFDGDFESSILEYSVSGSDIALVECSPSSSQPLARQNKEGTEVCYGAV